MTRFSILFLIAACSHPHDVMAVYALAPPAAGSLEVLLNSPSGALTVTVNDTVVVDRKESRKAHVDGIPAGTAHVTVATGGRCEHGAITERDVEITPGVVTTLVLPGPETTLGCQVYSGLYYVGFSIVFLGYAVLSDVAAHHHR